MDRLFWRLANTSLRVRVAGIFSLIFLAVGWLAATTLSAGLQRDMEKLLADQQFSHANSLVTEIEEKIALQTTAVERVARLITPELLADRRRLNEFLANRTGILSFFTGGLAVVGADGIGIAEYPQLGRVGRDYSQRSDFLEVKASGRPLLTDPYVSEMLGEPAVAMVVPVKDADGSVIATMWGVIRLGQANFVGQLADHKVGETGGIYLVAARTRMIIISTDRSRTFTPAPEPGRNLLMDRFIDGYEGSGVTVSSRGIEELVSGKRIPSTGWVLIVRLPTAEAYRPVERMKVRVATQAALLSVATLLLMWLVLGRAMRPLNHATRSIRAMVDGGEPLAGLRERSGGEVGELVEAFNALQAKIAFGQAELVAAQTALSEREARYHGIFEGCKAVQLLVDAENGRIVEANAAAERFYGWSRAELTGMPISRINTASPEAVAAELARARAEQREHFFFRHRLASGEVRDVEVHSGPVEISGRKLLYSIVHDITERRRAETESRVASTRLKLVLETVVEGIIGLDDEARVMFANRAAADLLGWPSAEAMQGRPSREALGHRLHGGVRCDDEHQCQIRDVLRDGATRRVSDEFFEAQNGTLLPVEYVASPLLVEEVVVGATIAFHDVSERLEAEREIRRLLAFRRAVLDAAGNAIIACDRDGMVMLFNPAAERLLGYSASEAVGQLRTTHFHVPSETEARATAYGRPPSADLPPQAALAAAVADADRPLVDEWTLVRKDGSHVPVLLSLSALRGDDQEHVGFIRIAQDISALKALEHDLKRSNSELERFAYVASHDLRQPLRMVSSYLTLLARRLGARLEEEEAEFLAFAVDGARRMDRMISDLLEYSRIGRNLPERERADLAELADAAIANLKPAIEEAGAGVSIDGPLPVVRGIPSQLERLFQNLIGNAVKFRAPDRAPQVAIRCREERNEWVVSVADNGIGIDPKHHDRLFTIFQRLVTQAEYDGTGIGLAACRKIAELHGGRVWVESQVGVGSTFHVSLPKALDVPAPRVGEEVMA